MQSGVVTSLCIAFLALGALSSLAFLVSSSIGRDSYKLSRVLYLIGVGKWFPSSTSRSVAAIKAMLGRLFGVPAHFERDQTIIHNTLVFLRTLSTIDALIRKRAPRKLLQIRLDPRVTDCEAVFFWHTVDYILHLNDLLYFAWGDRRTLIVPRRIHDPEFELRLRRLCGIYQRHVIFIHCSRDLLESRSRADFANAIWLIGAEFVYRNTKVSRMLQRKLYLSRSVCVHLPWPKQNYTWYRDTDFQESVNLYLELAQAHWQTSLIWPHTLKRINGKITKKRAET